MPLQGSLQFEGVLEPLQRWVVECCNDFDQGIGLVRVKIFYVSRKKCPYIFDTLSNFDLLQNSRFKFLVY